MAAPAAAAAPEAPRPEAKAESQEEDLLSFLHDDLLEQLDRQPSDAQAQAPASETSFDELMSSHMNLDLENPSAPTGEDWLTSSAEPAADPPSAPAPAVVIAPPAPAVVAAPPAPAVVAAPAASLPPAATERPAPPVPAQLPEAARTSTAVSPQVWGKVWGLAALEESPAGDPALDQLVSSYAERLCAAGRFRSAARALADWLEKHPGSARLKAVLKACLQAWVQNLAQRGRGPDAVRVGSWGATVLAGEADVERLNQQLQQRFGPPPTDEPGLPLAGGNRDHTVLRERVVASPDDLAILAQVQTELGPEPRAALHFFRQLALEHPQQANHQLNLGWIYLQARQPTLALVHTQRALALEGTPRGREQLADIYRALGQPNLADEALKG